MAWSQYSTDDFTDPVGTNGGRTVANFLTLPVSAQQLGCGITAGLGGQDATDPFFAPANTALLNRYCFAVTHMEWLMGLRKEYAGASFPLNDIGTLSFHSQVFTLGRFDNARDIDEYPSNPRALEAAVGTSFARSFWRKRVAVGLTAAYIESRLAGDDGRTFCAGIDGLLQPVPGFSGRLYARNLGSPLKYNGIAEPLPLQAGIAVRYFRPIRQDSLGNSPVTITSGLGCMKTAGAPLQIGAGTEVGLLGHAVLRVGYEYSYGRDASLAGLAAGCGLRVNRYGMDLGWKYQSPAFGSVWSVSATFASQELKGFSAMDYYLTAEKYFSRGKYNLCTIYCRKALAINPALWQAHSLMTKTLATMRRRQGTEIALIYTGNVAGQFIPKNIDSTTIGGLARQAAIIGLLRNQYPVSCAIDGGSLMTSELDILEAQFAQGYYTRVNFDAVSLGEGEVKFGLDRFLPELKKSGINFVCSNWTGKPNQGIVLSRIVNKGAYTLAILSIIDSAAIQSRDSVAALAGCTAALGLRVMDADVKAADLRICIVHDLWDKVQAYAAALPQIDIWICAAMDQPFQTPLRVGDALLISPGAGGRYVGALTLRFSAEKKIESVDNRLYQLNEDVVPDRDIEREALRISAIAEFQEPAGDHPTAFDAGDFDGVFPFVSTRKGAAKIYLKSISRYLEYPVSSGDESCSRPRLSAPLSCLLYLQESDSAHLTLLKITDLTGGHTRTLNLPGSVVSADFSPDSRWIYAIVRATRDTSTDIFRIKPAGGEPIPVITWDGSTENSVTFTGDGRNIVFVSDKAGKRQIYMADTSGANPLRLTKGRGNNLAPEISPDSRYLAYLSDQYSFGGRLNLMVADMYSGVAVRATHNITVREHLWFADNRTLIYSAGVNLYDFNRHDIFSRTTTKAIRSGNKKTYSEISPRFILCHDKPRIIYVRETLGGERHIFMTDIDGGRDQCIISSSGNDWIE
jgi:hypothetical protein